MARKLVLIVALFVSLLQPAPVVAQSQPVEADQVEEFCSHTQEILGEYNVFCIVSLFLPLAYGVAVDIVDPGPVMTRLPDAEDRQGDSFTDLGCSFFVFCSGEVVFNDLTVEECPYSDRSKLHFSNGLVSRLIRFEYKKLSETTDGHFKVLIRNFYTGGDNDWKKPEFFWLRLQCLQPTE